MTRVSWITPSGFSLILVAIAAALLGTEGLLRRPLLDEMSVTSIVLAEHLLLLVFAVPVVIAKRQVLRSLSWRHWVVLLIIGWGASGGAALLFTQALSTGNPTTASLLQNTQPLIVVLLALLLLKERLANLYWPCLAASIVGAYVLTFNTLRPVWVLDRTEVNAAMYALGAAALWASGTVLGRLVLAQMSYVTLTAARFVLAMPFLLVVALSRGVTVEAFTGIGASPLRLIAVALIPGLIAMLLFYRGLAGTTASCAVLAELTYPAAAIVGNWMMLGTTITALQALGCLTIIVSVLLLALRPASAPRPVASPTFGARGVADIHTSSPAPQIPRLIT